MKAKRKPRSKRVASDDGLGVTTTATRPSKLVTVFRYVSTPTDSSEPGFYTEQITVKELAVEQIKAQPFYT